MKKLKVLFLSFILLINIQLLFAEFDSLKEAVESEGFGADRDYRRERVSASGLPVGGAIP